MTKAWMSFSVSWDDKTDLILLIFPGLKKHDWIRFAICKLKCKQESNFYIFRQTLHDWSESPEITELLVQWGQDHWLKFMYNHLLMWKRQLYKTIEDWESLNECFCLFLSSWKHFRYCFEQISTVNQYSTWLHEGLCSVMNHDPRDKTYKNERMLNSKKTHTSVDFLKAKSHKHLTLKSNNIIPPAPLLIKKSTHWDGGQSTNRE